MESTLLKKIKATVKRIPLIGPTIKSVIRTIKKVLFPNSQGFPGSQAYWEARYASGGTSGAGSYGELAEYKATVLNSFIIDNNIQSVIEFGCGDGHQLSLAMYPNYIGLDVSQKAIELCKKCYRNDEHKSFFLYDPEYFVDQHDLLKAELALSLDVIYHLIEEKIFELHMQHLFSAAEKFVIIYSSNMDSKQSGHERHRQFSRWIDTHLPTWKLLEEIPNKYPYEIGNGSGSLAHFFIYIKIANNILTESII